MPFFMNRLTEYIRRIGKARGFGIQSPWAFSFVTEIIGERLPYYAYADIDRQYSSKRERKYEKLKLRVRNFVYPHPLLEVDIHDTEDARLADMIRQCGQQGVIMVKGIWGDEQSLDAWHTLQQRSDVGITFDLYDVGIVFLDTNIYKQHYSLNF